MNPKQKIRLLYIWIDSYKLLNKVGFNFSADYDIQFDPKNINLTINKNEVISEVFNDLKNITAIVGQNGSGKSTLLDVISETLYERYNPYGFAIFEKDNGEFIELFLSCGAMPFKNDLINSFDKNHEVQSKDPKFDNLKAGKIKGLGLIKYDPNLSNNVTKKKFNNRVDFHTLSKHKFSQINKQDPIHVFNNIPLIESSFEDSKFDDISIIYPINSLRIWDLINESFNLIYDRECDGYFSKIMKSSSLDAFYTLALDEMLPSMEKKIKTYDENHLHLIYSCFLSAFKLDAQVAKILSLLYVSDLISGKRKLDVVMDYFSLDAAMYIKQSRHDSNILVSLSKMFYNNFGRQGANEDILGFSFKKTDNNEHLGFIKELNDWTTTTSFTLTPSWLGISSGQLSLVNLFSGLLELNKKTRSRSILLLLDEAEQTLHPEWQRLFVSSILNFTKKFLQADSVQIVITTHSPFCLSDILNENVIYLKNDIKVKYQKVDSINQPKKSFAANIHSLLVNDFFMKKTIGEYSASLIYQTVQFMENSGNNKLGKIKSWDDARAVIDQVADDLMREELNRIYKEKNNKGAREELVGKLTHKKDELLRLIEVDDFLGLAKIIEEN
ncbi:MAG: AAA family ATPase [Colwellia sp.]|nr:AAA family ATPase [Colwellia sp.]